MRDSGYKHLMHKGVIQNPCTDVLCGCRHVNEVLQAAKEKSLENLDIRIPGTMMWVAATDSRKRYPITTGVLDYFPLAIAAVAECSYVGNEQHNPGKPLHWDRSKSQDEADALGRHLAQRGTVDTDGIRHSAKVAWRALALLQKELEAAGWKLP